MKRTLRNNAPVGPSVHVPVQDVLVIDQMSIAGQALASQNSVVPKRANEN